MLHAQDIKSLQPDKRLFTPSEVYTTFKKMSDSDLHLLGLSDEYARPEWMILTVLPVPPPPVRPSIAVDGGAMRSEDDLTYKLGDIIKASANVRRCEQEGAPAHVINEFEQLLQVCHVEPFFGSVLLNSSSFTLPLTWTMTSLGFLRHYRNQGGPLRLFVRV